MVKIINDFKHKTRLSDVYIEVDPNPKLLMHFRHLKKHALKVKKKKRGSKVILTISKYELYLADFQCPLLAGFISGMHQYSVYPGHLLIHHLRPHIRTFVKDLWIGACTQIGMFLTLSLGMSSDFKLAYLRKKYLLGI